MADNLLVCRDDFIVNGATKIEAARIAEHIARTCPTITRQVQKMHIRNGKEFPVLRFVQFVDIIILKHCAENMLYFSADKRTSKALWRRILEIVNKIEESELQKEEKEEDDC